MHLQTYLRSAITALILIVSSMSVSALAQQFGQNDDPYAMSGGIPMTGKEVDENRALALEKERLEAVAREYEKIQRKAVDDLTHVLSTLRASIDSKLGLLQGHGYKLLTALGVIAFSWLGIKHMLQGTSFAELIGEAIVLIFTIGMVKWVIDGVPQGQNDLSFIGGIAAGFDQIAGEIMASGGAQGTITTPDTMIHKAVASFLYTALKIYEQPVKLGFDPTSWIPALAIVLSKLFMTLFMLAITLAYLATYVMSQVLLGIAWILAPVLVPFFVVQPTSFLATGWFKFLISAGMVKVVGALMITLTMQFVILLPDMFANVNADDGVPMGVYLIALLIVGIMAFMMMSAWTIGNAIITGFPHMKPAMPSKLQPGGMANAASGSLQRAGGSAAGAAARTAGVGTAAAAGAMGGATTGAKGSSGSGLDRAKAGASGALQGAKAGIDAFKGKSETEKKKNQGTLNPLQQARAGAAAASASAAGKQSPGTGQQSKAASPFPKLNP